MEPVALVSAVLLNNMVKSSGVGVALLLSTHTAVQGGVRQLISLEYFPPGRVADSLILVVQLPMIKSDQYLPFKKKQFSGGL